MSTLGTSTCGCVISACQKYRYALWRFWEWESAGVAMAFIGLNPSTADHQQDDPTIRRCIGFAKREGYGGIYMLNLFAYRSTDPTVLYRVENPIGPKNYEWIAEIHERAGKTVACWGSRGTWQNQDVYVARLSRVGPDAKTKYVGDDLWCLGRTKDGHPRHPLYLRLDAPLSRYRVKEHDA